MLFKLISNIMQYDAIFLSVPYTEPVPMVAPVLLSACIEKDGLKGKGIDFGLSFYQQFHNKPYWPILKSQLITGWLENTRLPKRAIIDILKFNKKTVLDIEEKYNPKWIGLSIFTLESIDYSQILIYSIRRYLPNVKIIVGGKGSESTEPQSGKRHYERYINSGQADLAVVGDCEHIIGKLLKEDAKGVIIAPSQTKEDLDNTPIPNWEHYDLHVYNDYYKSLQDEPYMAISSSKGCIRDCTFCDVGSFWPKYIYRNPELVANEIITAYKKTGIRRFQFTDNLINGSTSHYHQVNQILADNIPNTIGYSGYAIFRNKNHMPEEEFELASRAGCKEWAIGVEGGSEKVRFDMRKKVTDEDTDWSIEMLDKYDIEQKWLMMVGYPTETEKDFQLTLDLMSRWAHIGRKGKISISITPTFMLLHNSPLMQDKRLVNELGLEHNVRDVWGQKLWTSTTNPENTFPVRLDRWRRAIDLQEQLGYKWAETSPKELWIKELNELLELYKIKESNIIESLANAHKRKRTIPIFEN